MGMPAQNMKYWFDLQLKLVYRHLMAENCLVWSSKNLNWFGRAQIF